MVEESKQKAPGTVVALGSLWLIATGGSLAWALSMLVVFGVVSNFTPGGLEGMPEPPPIAEPIHWAFQHYALVGSVVGVLSLFGVYSGIKFLRLRPWAHRVLEAGGWVAIGLSLVVGLWRSQFWTAVATGGSTDIHDGYFFRVFYGLFIAAYLAVFPGVFVWFLRSRSVRQSFAVEASARSISAR